MVLFSFANRRRYVGLTARPVKDDKNKMISMSVHIHEKTLTEIKITEKIQTSSFMGMS